MYIVILKQEVTAEIEIDLIADWVNIGGEPKAVRKLAWRNHESLPDTIFETYKQHIEYSGKAPEYLLSSRYYKKEDSQITVNGFAVGGESPLIIAGPCSAESYDQLAKTCSGVVEAGVNFFRAGLYKPRSSPYSFQGLKSDGVKLIDQIKHEFGVSIVTEVMGSDHLDEVAEVADIIQIGSRNMHNFSLLEEIAKVGKPILLKRGMAATMKEFLLAAEYILINGNEKVILCERGIKTFETHTRNTLDLNVVPFVRQESHLPIIVDPSHGTGIRSFVEPMSLAALACGAQGLEIEVHHNPDLALSDGAQSLTIPQFKNLMKKVDAQYHQQEKHLLATNY